MGNTRDAESALSTTPPLGAGTRCGHRLTNRPFLILMVVVALGVAGYLPVLNFISLYIRDQLGVGLSGAAWMLIGTHTATGTIGLASGLWIRRAGSRWTYAAGLAGMALFVAVIALTHHPIWFVAVAPVSGFALALHWSGLQTYTLEVTPPGRRGLASGIITVILVVAPGIAGILQGVVADAYGFRAMAGIATILLVAALLGAILVLPTVSSGTKMSSAAGSLATYTRLALDRHIAVLLVTRAVTSFAYAVFTLLAGPKFIVAGGDLRTVGFFLLAGSVGGAVAQIGIGYLSDSMGRRGVFSLSVIIGAGATIGFGLANSVVLLLILSGAFALAFWSYQTLLLALAGDVALPGTTDQVVALLTSSFAWGMAAGTIATGLLADGMLDATFWVAGSVTLLGLMMTPWLGRRRDAPSKGASPPA